MSESAVIFDFNGTLLWDTEVQNKAWDVFLAGHGIWMSDKAKCRRIYGKTNREIMSDIFKGKCDEGQLLQRAQEKEAVYRELLGKADLQLAEGVVELFDRLKAEGIPFAIATASGWENVSFYIERYGLHRWFAPERIVYNDGTLRGKPHPDLFLRGMERLGVRARKNVVVFEDSMAGIQAAEAAGAGAVVVVDSGGVDCGLWEGKRHVIRSFLELRGIVL
ncbi:HAD family hydrolase [Anaerotalea alkaliphila]|uniref:HAD family phosphatase n=1 Tax=Anaerotalea alkaliphila TaxID=2662126 RepID=A0A7X5HUF6_9FIRM|nr:HAD family phosphatase [Anaerotalea alkaliphila]NDL66863.1 HAD family phosphatase [Anaerotalea alkaliphila]